MPSIFTLEGHTPHLLGDGKPDNMIVAWMKRQSFPVAAMATAGLSIGVGFVLASAALKLVGSGRSLSGTRTKIDINDPSLAALMKGQRDGMAGRGYSPPAAHIEKYRQGYDIGSKHRANRK